MLIMKTHVPKIPCAVFAFLLGEFMLAQNIVVLFTAINAFLLVVKRIKIDLGIYDWKLLISAFGIPVIVYTGVAADGMLGSSGAWFVKIFLFDL